MELHEQLFCIPFHSLKPKTLPDLRECVYGWQMVMNTSLTVGVRPCVLSHMWQMLQESTHNPSFVMWAWFIGSHEAAVLAVSASTTCSTLGWRRVQCKLYWFVAMRNWRWDRYHSDKCVWGMRYWLAFQSSSLTWMWLPLACVALRQRLSRWAWSCRWALLAVWSLCGELCAWAQECVCVCCVHTCMFIGMLGHTVSVSVCTCACVCMYASTRSKRYVHAVLMRSSS